MSFRFGELKTKLLFNMIDKLQPFFAARRVRFTHRLDQAVFPQQFNFHIHLVCDHGRFQNAAIFSKRCISFQSPHCVNLHPLVISQPVNNVQPLDTRKLLRVIGGERYAQGQGMRPDHHVQ